MEGSARRATIAVAICTYNRNEPLRTLLNALLANATRLSNRAAVGVVVVDDSSDERARGVVEEFKDRFELGIHYRISGMQNISIARNLAIETACELANWTAMTDDDCEPPPEWLESLLDVQNRTGADAVTGSMVRRVPPGSPRWLAEEPFLELGLWRPEDGAELTTASTFNSMISSQWLKDHSHLRFHPKLGVIGGEDMVFYRAARAEGLRIHFSHQGFVYENEPLSRANFRYQLRLFFWHGNSTYVTSVASGTHPIRVFLQGAASLARSLVRPWVRVFSGRTPQFRFCLASALHAFGRMIGPFGIRVDHK
jgi:succinoglycan biosynthesis protein ExoM